MQNGFQDWPLRHVATVIRSARSAAEPREVRASLFRQVFGHHPRVPSAQHWVEPAKNSVPVSPAVAATTSRKASIQFG
jgi:hypothetical protein